MSGQARAIGGAVAWVCGAEGPLLGGERAAADLVGEALGAGAGIVVVPVGRLAPGFLSLGTRMAGEAIQKFVNYGLKVAFVGDISDALAASGALRDFVRESNRGRHVWFVADEAELATRLAWE
jgi:hypothetical protein